MKKYLVKVIRTEYAMCEFEVEAENPNQAEIIAADIVGDFIYKAYAADYEIDYVEELTPNNTIGN